VRYSAALFARLRRANRSITHAIAHYHSTTRARNRPYTKKVVRLWNVERRRYFNEQQMNKLAAWQAEREQRKQVKMAAAAETARRSNITPRN
jgi:flagellar basal body rod protein FlgC